MGPSHKVYLNGCALTRSRHYETPLGNLEIDHEVTRQLHDLGGFVYMGRAVDENEHSLEMHLPYIRKVLPNKDLKIVPIMVGNLTAE